MKKKNDKINPKKLVLGSIAKFERASESPVFVASTVGSINENVFTDVLLNNRIYKIYTNYNDAKLAIKEGSLRIGEEYCYSIYDYKKEFPLISKMKTKEEIINYLKSYNDKEDVAIYWTFLDKDEIDKLDKKKKRLY